MLSYLKTMNYSLSVRFRSTGPQTPDTDKSGVALKLVWLERGHPRASAVADVLSAAGFPDFGKQLQQLAKEPSPR